MVEIQIHRFSCGDYHTKQTKECVCVRVCVCACVVFVQCVNFYKVPWKLVKTLRGVLSSCPSKRHHRST